MADILTVKVEAPGVAELLDKFASEVSRIVANAVFAEREACAAICARISVEEREKANNGEAYGASCCARSICERANYDNTLTPAKTQQGIPAKIELQNKPQAYMVISYEGAFCGVHRFERDAKEFVIDCGGKFVIVPLYIAGQMI